MLIKARIAPGLDPSGQLDFKGQGDKTVDEQQIIGRLGQLGIRLDGSREELREVVAQSAILVRQLFDALVLDPADVLDTDCWEFLLENETVFKGELARRRASTTTLVWRSPTMARAAKTHLPVPVTVAPSW